MITATDTGRWLGEKVDAAIADSGIKKKAIAEKTGIPYSTLNSKIHGYSSFNFDDILRIANALHRSPADFVPPEFSPQVRAA